MTTTLALTPEEFASQRRAAQDRYADALRPVVENSLESGSWSRLLIAVRSVYADAYYEETGDSMGFPPPRGWMQELEDTLEKTKGEGEATVERISVWLAAAVLNIASIEAARSDPDELILEWVDMRDENVREEHRRTHGQQRPIGDSFDVDGVPMRYPGDSTAPIELWINCRCTLRPVLAREAYVSEAPEPFSSTTFRDVPADERKRDAKEGRALPDGSYPIDNCSDLRNAIQAIGRAKNPDKVKAHIRKRKRALGCPEVELPDSFAADDDPVEQWNDPKQAESDDVRTGTVVVALPAEDNPVHKYGDEQKHVTLLYLETADDSVVEELRKDVEALAQTFEPFNAHISGTAVLGPDRAKVLLVEAHDFNALRGGIEEDQKVQTALRAMDTHPHFVPHMTLTYGELDEDVDLLGQALHFDRLAVWNGSEQTEYPLGAGMENDDEALTAAVAGDVRVPWHGVLAPEGVRSGDRRKFKEGSLTHRDLPLPLTWQKISDDGHKGNITVATIEQITMEDGLMKASGWFLDSEEADEVAGLIAEFGKFGVSVDADDVTFEMDEENEEVVFSAARVSSACIVPIPAFAEAWVALGTWEDSGEGAYNEEEAKAAPEYDLVPRDEAAGSESEQFVGRTEDGPGWLTHPVDTDRLRDYWVRGPGAAKIAWGTPGDFNRCRANVAEYVKPQHINGYCANRHYDALGKWPGRGKGRHAADSLEFTEAAEAMTLTAAATGHRAPAEWFTQPNLAEPTPLTVTDEGRVFGHLATWGTCHIGFADQCVTPPHSMHEYAYFLTGEVALDNGERVPCGQITIGGGHASPNLGMKPALAHYDATSAVVADVTVGEDKHGIWFSGWVRPGADDDMVTALRASALSGDWRKVAGNLELVAALAVNVPGFGVPRPKVAASSEGQLSLVASGVVAPDKEGQPTQREAEKIADSLAASVAAILEERAARRARMQALAARITKE